MYFVQDAHSFWNWVYFVLLIVVSKTHCWRESSFLHKFFSFFSRLLLWGRERKCFTLVCCWLGDFGVVFLSLLQNSFANFAVVDLILYLNRHVGAQERREGNGIQFLHLLLEYGSDCHVHVLADWLVLHDQPVPGRHRHPVLGDEAARDCQDEGRTRALPVIVHPLVLHQFGDDQLLQAGHQAHCSPHPPGSQQSEEDLQEVSSDWYIDVIRYTTTGVVKATTTSQRASFFSNMQY